MFGMERCVGILKCNDVITGLYVRDALADRFDNTSALVPEDNGEGALGVLSGERVCICLGQPLSENLDEGINVPVWQTPV